MQITALLQIPQIVSEIKVMLIGLQKSCFQVMLA